MVLRLLEGSVDVASVRGRRTVPAAELFAGPLESTLAHDEVRITARLAEGEASATAWGCDLSYEYVRINGSYRT